MNKVVPVG